MGLVTEFIDAELVGQVEEYHGTAITISEPLATYARTRKQRKSNSSKGTAHALCPGYLDRTSGRCFSPKPRPRSTWPSKGPTTSETRR